MNWIEIRHNQVSSFSLQLSRECSTQVEIQSGDLTGHELEMTCNSCLHEAACVRLLPTLVEVLHFPTALRQRPPR